MFRGLQFNSAAGLLPILIFLGCLELTASSGASSRQTEADTKEPRLAFKPRKAFSVLLGKEPADPPEVLIGERLFLETRFSQFYFARSKGNPNASVKGGETALDEIYFLDQRIPGPFAGFSMSCRSCHMVNDAAAQTGENRSYSDYSRRSRLPAREDGRSMTVRNSPAMVNASISRHGNTFFHFDGEFTSARELVKATLTGRNYGWLAHERSNAVAYIANVIRRDDGTAPLAQSAGGAYRQVFAAEYRTTSEEFEIPASFRLNVFTATDEQILDAISALIEEYMSSLFFSRDELGEYDGSPYDAFLEKNHLPRRPADGMTPIYYSRHLLNLIEDLPTVGFIGPAEGRFQLEKQEFRFGPQELAGLKIFFRLDTVDTAVTGRKRGSIGNCIACHAAPDFTDFAFHNTGAAQEEYDVVHGQGSFAKLAIPSLEERAANYDAFLPSSAAHPRGLGPFLDIPAAGKPNRTDLGLWNVFANPDQPMPQQPLQDLLAGKRSRISKSELLTRAIGLFKTPGLRGLSLSHPYLHTGGKDTIDDVLRFYIRFSELARQGKVRNGDPELSHIQLRPVDIAPLAAFLKALNEDYE